MSARRPCVSPPMLALAATSGFLVAWGWLAAGLGRDGMATAFLVAGALAGRAALWCHDQVVAS